MPLPKATWTRLVSAPRLRRSSHALSVLNNHAYIFGGELQPRQPVDNQVDQVALASSEQETLLTLPASTLAPTPRVGTPSTTLPSTNTLYIFSGRGGAAMAPLEEKGAIWSFSATARTWTRLDPADPTAPFPPGRSYHAIASDGARTLFVHAGCPAQGRLRDLWAFDVPERRWRELPPAPGAARGGAALAFCRGRLQRAHGFDGKMEQGGAVDVFDVAKGEWETVAYQADGVEGPGARSVSALLPITVKGRQWLVTLFGEGDPSALGHAGAGKMWYDVWGFDVDERRWEKVDVSDGGDVPAPRGWFDADVVKDETGAEAIIVHGGLAEDNSRLGDVWKMSFV